MRGAGNTLFLDQKFQHEDWTRSLVTKSGSEV